MEGMESVIQEFLAESFEGIEELRPDLENLTNAVADQEAILRLYLVVHTIKGTSGFLMFSKLEGLTKAAQAVLAHIRDDQQELQPEIAQGLLAAFEATSAMLEQIKSSDHDGDNEYADLIAKLNAF